MPPIKEDPTVRVAKLGLVGSLLVALIGLGGDIASREPAPPPPGPAAVNCTVELDRFDRYLGVDAKKVTMLTAKGADGIAPIEKDSGAKACGIDRDDLQVMIVTP
jgi:hypothetical protein